tara:strand:+ start:2803 stop:3138 length:336 start_codon:yes stop_codon:yes gene_type:complete
MKYELITVGGKERAIRYGFWALAQFCEMCNIKLSDLGKLEKDLTLKQAIFLIYVGLEDGARKSGTDFDLKVEQIADYIDEDESLITRSLDIFTKFQSKPDKKEKAVTGKKK